MIATTGPDAPRIFAAELVCVVRASGRADPEELPAIFAQASPESVGRS
jgi:hypothetical protein